MNNKPEDFVHRQGINPKKEDSYGFTSIEILQQLIGLPWCSTTMCYVLALKPSSIRVSSSEVTCDAFSNRITVWIKGKNKIIENITWEVQIPTPELNGFEMSCMLNELIKARDSK